MYGSLMEQWAKLSDLHMGWTLSEIKDLSPRERLNWLEIARAVGKVIKKNDITS